MKSYPKDYCMDLVVLDDRKGRTKTHLRLFNSKHQMSSQITKAAKKKLLMKQVERIHAFKKSP